MIKYIKKPAIGIFFQLMFSFLFMLLVGMELSWRYTHIFLFSFIISLLSSAIILEYLYKHKELKTPLGILTTGILVFQDFLVVPMLMVLNFIGHGELRTYQLYLGVAATLLVLFLLREIAFKRKIMTCRYLPAFSSASDLHG